MKWKMTMYDERTCKASATWPRGWYDDAQDGGMGPGGLRSVFFCLFQFDIPNKARIPVLFFLLLENGIIMMMVAKPNKTDIAFWQGFWTRHIWHVSV